MKPDRSLPESVETLIVGAGLAGLSAAHHMDGERVVVEAHTEPGGAARSWRYRGFALDRAIHVLYFKDGWTKDWITNGLGIPLTRHERHSAVWVNGALAPYPIQFHLFALPAKQRLGILWSLLLSRGAPRTARPTTLAEWAKRNFGSALAKLFFEPYNQKVWGVPPSQLGLAWMGSYVPPPHLRDILVGLMGPQQRRYGGNATFYYPEAGGIGTIAEVMASKSPGPIHYGMQLASVELQRHVACFTNGAAIRYKRLVNTMPLRELAGRTTPAIPGLADAAAQLRSTPSTIAHILVPRAGIGDKAHWIYVPDPVIPFYRISFPGNINRANCPQGWSAITLEFGGKVHDRASAARASKAALIRWGFMRSEEISAELLWDEVAHGYVVYDAQYAEARSRALRILGLHDVICLGRYGRWEYANMESALIQGRELGQKQD